ncbi:MAG: NAD(+)/NADH kinase [Bacteroidales bacterium]|nr:NAD(+)/NADH kinase [Bacteroidales bacterium]
MKIAIYIGKKELRTDSRMLSMIEELRCGGCDLHDMTDDALIPEGTDLLLSVGGDGTFLSASALVADKGIPVLGVNLGRMGFLSENRPEDVAQAVLSGEYTVEKRTMLHAEVETGSAEIDSWPYALNEMTVRRSGAAMLGVDVSVDGIRMPTYWADGLVISTSSGSTAYSLSVGGPIVLPESKVLIVSPIAPHNLNVRPLVVPDTAELVLKMHSRDGSFEFSADNRTAEVGEDTEVSISVAQFSLKRVRLNRSNFIKALTEKLFWGEDVRNIK